MFASHGTVGRRPTANSQQSFTAGGFHTLNVPLDAYDMCVVGVESGQGGGARWSGSGGRLRYKNRIQVFPGEQLSVYVGYGGAGSSSISDPGSAGEHTYIQRAGVTIFSTAWSVGSGDNACDGGGDGGFGSSGDAVTTPYGTVYNGGGGGGAGGYSGPGGNGASAVAATAGTGGAGGGGGSDSSDENYNSSSDYYFGTAGRMGGGVCLLGEGTSGAAGERSTTPSAGGVGSFVSGATAVGAGGNAGYTRTSNASSPGAQGSPGAHGGLRTIFGMNRAFPSTNTGDL